MVDAGLKKCPECAEDVKAEARVCRFCGYRFGPPAATPSQEPSAARAETGAERAIVEQRGVAAAELVHPRHERRRLLLVVGYIVAVALWLLAVLPTGRQLGSGTGVVAAAAFSLVVALVIRAVYVAIRRRRHPDRAFWSPWIFVLAAVLAWMSFLANKTVKMPKPTPLRLRTRSSRGTQR